MYNIRRFFIHFYQISKLPNDATKTIDRIEYILFDYDKKNITKDIDILIENLEYCKGTELKFEDRFIPVYLNLYKFKNHIYFIYKQ